MDLSNRREFENSTEKNAVNNNIDWVIDATASSSDEEDFPAVVVKKIPRFHECNALDDALQRKINAKKILSATSNQQVAELMKKSVIQPGFEQLRAVPPSLVSRRILKKERKKERDRTKGPKWFNLPVQELTKEVKDDIDLLRMRSVLDNKRFYKNNDLSHVPKYFQIGTVLETPADFYSSRIPKSLRSKTLLGELMADAESRALQKKKYKAIIKANMHKREKRKLGDKNPKAGGSSNKKKHEKKGRLKNKE